MAPVKETKIPPTLAALLQRMEEILAEKGWAESEWSSLALPSPAHVGIIMRKLRAGIDPNAKGKTWEALATAAGVPAPWLQHGIGPRERAANSTDSPTPPPASETRVTNDALDEVLDAVYDPVKHRASDLRLATESLEVAFSLARGNVDQPTFARMLLDAAAKARLSGRKVTAAELPYLALGDLDERLTEASKKLAAMQEESRRWAAENGVQARTPGDLHPSLAGLVKAGKGPARRR